MYLDQETFARFVELQRIAETKGATLQRPRRQGERWAIERKDGQGQAITCDSLEDVERMLRWIDVYA